MKISFIVPAYNTEYQILRICINSILHCLGNKHELIIVDDASSTMSTVEFLNRCKFDTKFNIKVLRNKENSGVSYSLNKGVEASGGQFIAPVDHDDLVIPSGIKAICMYTAYYDVPWMYSDETQVTANGNLLRYLFKPDYSKQLLRSVMYINHLQVFSKDLFLSAGGYREGFEGSQDHDLALRMSERVAPSHVPAFAYHWRIMPTTQSRIDHSVSQQSIRHSMTALQQHFDRLETDVTIRNVRSDLSVYKVRIIPKSQSRISIIIPCKFGTTRTSAAATIVLLDQCLKSIQSTIYSTKKHLTELPDVEVILVLNDDDDIEAANHIIENHGLSGFAINDQPHFNFSRKCNLGAQVSTGQILIFLNDDTEFITTDWIEDVVSLLSEDDVACIGGMLLSEDGSVQSCGDNVSLNSATHYDPYPFPDNEGDPFHRYHADHETTSITGAFFCCRKKVFSDLDGFDETFSNSFQDVDFCLRARKRGLRCVVSPHIKLFHFESSTRDPSVDDATLLLLRTVHSDIMAAKDEYSLWAHQPVRAPLWSPARIIHEIIQTRSRIISIITNFPFISSRQRERFTTLIE